MKKYFKLLIVMLTLTFLCGFSSEQTKVYDNAGILSEDEEEKLQELCIEYAYSNEADIVIVTVDGLDGESITRYADDYYDYNGFGYEKEMGTGIILVIDMDSREFRVSTSGDCVDLLSDRQINTIISNIANELSKGNNYKACANFIEEFDRQYNESKLASGEDQNRDIIVRNVVALVIALAIGGMVTGIVYSGHSTKMTVNAYTYERDNKPEVKGERDFYVRTTRTVRHIPKPSDTGNSSHSSHVGSSGNRHGGGSGRF